MDKYVLSENDLTMNPITGKPVIGKDYQRFYNESKRSKLNQIERGNQKFYNKLKDYISNEGKTNFNNLNSKLSHNKSFDVRNSNQYHNRSLSVQKGYLSQGNFLENSVYQTRSYCDDFYLLFGILI